MYNYCSAFIRFLILYMFILIHTKFSVSFFPFALTNLQYYCILNSEHLIISVFSLIPPFSSMSCTAYCCVNIIASAAKGAFMSLPNDPVILLSYINTLLRDEYSTFEELCKSLCVSEDDIVSKLSGIGYVYDNNTNSFR